MPKTTKKKPRDKVTLDFLSRVSITAARFNGQTWFHLRQNKNKKSVTLSSEELKEIIAQQNALKNAAKEVYEAEQRKVSTEVVVPEEETTGDEASSKYDSASESSEVTGKPAPGKKRRKSSQSKGKTKKTMVAAKTSDGW